MLLDGTFAPITTPFYPDGRLYLRKLEHNTDRYSRTPLAGLVVLGSTGESVMLNDDESQQVLRIAAESTAAEKILIAGIGRESVKSTLELADFAADCRYDAVLVRTPHFFRTQYENAPWIELLTFYRTVADHSPLPVLIYNCPYFTAFNLPVEVVAELASHPNIIGMKESSSAPARMADLFAATRQPRYTVTVTPTFTAVTGRMLAPTPDPMEAVAAASFISADLLGAGATALAVPPPRAEIKTRTKEVGFQLLSGSADRTLEAFDAGAVGSVHGFAVCSPQSSYEVYAAWKDGDRPLADEKLARVAAPSVRICAELGIAAVKYAAELTGYYGGLPRLPILPLTAAQRAEVERRMAGIKN
jgi:dihydrodipicolinate synthase/N-acetylneuraminate lyase